MLGSCTAPAEPVPAFWLSPRLQDGNANRNGEALGEKMSTALGRVPGSLPPWPACHSLGCCWWASPLVWGLLALSACLYSRAGLPQRQQVTPGLHPWTYSPPRRRRRKEEEGRQEEGQGDAGHTPSLGQASWDWHDFTCYGTDGAFPAFWLRFLVERRADKSSHPPQRWGCGIPKDHQLCTWSRIWQGGTRLCQGVPGRPQAGPHTAVPATPPPRAQGRRWRHAGR